MRNEAILQHVLHSLKGIINTNEHQPEDNHLFKVFYRFLGCYSDITPHPPVEEILEFVYSSMELFCADEKYSEDIDPWTMDYLNAITSVCDGEEILEVIQNLKQPFLASSLYCSGTKTSTSSERLYQ